IGVFMPVTGAMLTAGTPVGAGIGPYTRSKIAAELVARGSQQAGSPVVATSSTVMQGPHDPHLGDSVRFVRDLLRGRLPVLPRGRLSFVDVRDVGALHEAVLRPGRGARRYLLGGPAVEVTDVAALLGELTGRRLPQRTAPDWVLQHSGRLADRVQRLIPVRLPASAEQAALPLSIPAGVVVDDSATRQELAIERRELRETLADTVPWLADPPPIRPAPPAGRSSRPGPANPPPRCRPAAMPGSGLPRLVPGLGDRRPQAQRIKQRCGSSRLFRVVSGAHDPGHRGCGTGRTAGRSPPPCTRPGRP